MNLDEPTVHLLVGAGPEFGTGHLVRMSELRDLLGTVGVPTTWREVGFRDVSTALASELPRGDRGLALLDLRDLDPTPFQSTGRPVLALDNRWPGRDSLSAACQSPSILEFYDTIPHPAADLRQTLERSLIRADVRAGSDDGPAGLETASKFRHSRRDRHIFVYSGEFPARELDRALATLGSQGFSVSRCGTDPTREDIEWNSGLERADFVRKLIQADCVCTYFGMTLLEAWYLGAVPALIPVPSKIHTELADYLSQAVDLPYWQPCTDPGAWERRIAELTALPRVPESGAHAQTRPAFAGLRPGGAGFRLLLARILELLRAQPDSRPGGSAD